MRELQNGCSSEFVASVTGGFMSLWRLCRDIGIKRVFDFGVSPHAQKLRQLYRRRPAILTLTSLHIWFSNDATFGKRSSSPFLSNLTQPLQAEDQA